MFPAYIKVYLDATRCDILARNEKLTFPAFYPYLFGIAKGLLYAARSECLDDPRATAAVGLGWLDEAEDYIVTLIAEKPKAKTPKETAANLCNAAPHYQVCPQIQAVLDQYFPQGSL